MFVRCREEVYYKSRLVKVPAWMHDQGDGFADKPNLEYLEVSLRLDVLQVVDCHEYWARNCDSNMHIHTNRQQIEKFVGWHSVEAVVQSM